MHITKDEKFEKKANISMNKKIGTLRFHSRQELVISCVVLFNRVGGSGGDPIREGFIVP